MPVRKILEGIVYLLPTGCQWKALPKEVLEVRVRFTFISFAG